MLATPSPFRHWIPKRLRLDWLCASQLGSHGGKPPIISKPLGSDPKTDAFSNDQWTSGVDFPSDSAENEVKHVAARKLENNRSATAITTSRSPYDAGSVLTKDPDQLPFRSDRNSTRTEQRSIQSATKILLHEPLRKHLRHPFFHPFLNQKASVETWGENQRHQRETAIDPADQHRSLGLGRPRL